MKILLIAMCSLFCIVIIYSCIKHGKPVRTLLISALTGILALVIVNSIGCFVGKIALGFTPLTVGTSAVLGVPGVITLVVFRLIMN